jgi:hypothetical protein
MLPLSDHEPGGAANTTGCCKIVHDPHPHLGHVRMVQQGAAPSVMHGYRSG